MNFSTYMPYKIQTKCREWSEDDDASLRAAFEAHVYDRARENIGPESDVDGNGRVIGRFGEWRKAREPAARSASAIPINQSSEWRIAH